MIIYRAPIKSRRDDRKVFQFQICGLPQPVNIYAYSKKEAMRIAKGISKKLRG